MIKKPGKNHVNASYIQGDHDQNSLENTKPCITELLWCDVLVICD